MTKFLHPNDYVVPRRSMLSWRLNRRNIFPDKDIIKREVVASGSTIQEACLWSVYVVFHNQFLVALKRLQVDKQELVHKSANETVSLNDETKDSACFTRKFYVKSAKAPARIGKELVHKSANEIVMVSTYTRIKAIPIGHIRLINGDNLDTQTPMTSKTLGGVFVYLKIPTLFASVIFSSKALRTANFRWVAGSKSFCGYLRSDCCNACPPRKHFLITRKVLVPLDLSYLEVKKQREREVSSRGDIIKLDLESLNDETKDSACFTRKFYVKSAKAPARIEKGKLWLLDQLFKKHVYGVRAGAEKMYNVFHNQFLVALKRLQVDKQELVHKSANETVMVSTYTRIKAIPIGHIRLINGDNLDTQTPMTSKTLGAFVVISDLIVAMHVLRENISSSQELVMRKVLVPVDLSYLEVKKQRIKAIPIGHIRLINGDNLDTQTPMTSKTLGDLIVAMHVLRENISSSQGDMVFNWKMIHFVFALLVYENSFLRQSIPLLSTSYIGPRHMNRSEAKAKVQSHLKIINDNLGARSSLCNFLKQDIDIEKFQQGDYSNLKFEELVHKSANEIVMVSTYTRIKAIPIGHIRLINGDNLDTQTPMTSKTLGGVFVYLKIPTLFASVIFSSKALRTANFRWVAGSKSFCGYLRSDCCNACPPRKHFLITRKVLVPLDLSYLEVKKQS
ncbi:hypothetical protein DY000_02030263 [Brassica cretica]|uniref:Uncharacterized protein n=1 Tax=Brassica cretica TaxID=69181 RepID=A0ABQ7DP96_BRACR|nr:hypothetical protein DY000_02030263 [Brassica cretica]